MAPEVIKNEPCSEKVDIWSFGVVLWELITCDVPYKGVDSSAIIWGVGNNTLSLPIPTECPDGYRLLMNLCWNLKPKNRPSFKIILHHLEIAGIDLIERLFMEKNQFSKLRERWRQEINGKMTNMKLNNNSIHHFEKELVKKREDEWRFAKEIRQTYESRLALTNMLLFKLRTKEQEILKREKEINLNRERLNLHSHKNSNREYCFHKKSRSFPQLEKPDNLTTSCNEHVNSHALQSPEDLEFHNSASFIMEDLLPYSKCNDAINYCNHSEYFVRKPTPHLKYKHKNVKMCFSEDENNVLTLKSIEPFEKPSNAFFLNSELTNTVELMYKKPCENQGNNKKSIDAACSNQSGEVTEANNSKSFEDVEMDM